MKTRVTSVQLAILDTKQLRAEHLLQSIDALNDEITALLEIDLDCDDEALIGHVNDFLNQRYTARELCASIGIEVAS